MRAQTHSPEKEEGKKHGGETMQEKEDGEEGRSS